MLLRRQSRRLAQPARQILAVHRAEAPGQLGGTRDADPRPGSDLDALPLLVTRAKLERRLEQRGAVQVQPDGERLRQLAGARAQVAKRVPAAPPAHLLDPP